MIDKRYISAQSLLEDAFRLGLMVLRSDYRPSVILGIWRGGAPVGIAVQEILAVHGVVGEHYPIRTVSYSGIGRREREIRIWGLDEPGLDIGPDDRVLLVDDVHDTGLSLRAVIDALAARGAQAPATVRVAAPWFKPGSNRIGREPDYFVHRTDAWLVFPHELDGLTRAELLEHKPGLRTLYEEYGL